jgi:uncharacterized protein YraI
MAWLWAFTICKALPARRCGLAIRIGAFSLPIAPDKDLSVIAAKGHASLCLFGQPDPAEETAMFDRRAIPHPFRLAAIARALGLGLALALAAGLAGTGALAQVSERAEPVTGPGVTTIGNIATNARVNLRAGPAVLFPVVGTLGYGTRVEKGLCIGGGSARWCEVTTMDGKTSGYVAARFLVEGSAPPPDDGLAGGPDFWAVRGLGANERLGVRLEPRSGSTVLATLQNGEIVRNLGCRMTGATRWCQIRSTTGVDVTGWVAGSYLRESGPPSGSGGGGGGSDILVVTGLAAGDTLNVRSGPSTQNAIIARLAEGAKVRNRGCEQSGQTRWCRVTTIGGVEVTGWVNARYLRAG